MKIVRNTLLAATALPLLVAFDNNAGWKMDGDKLALDKDGNPIWINTAGAEQSVKGDTITTLNAEAKSHRTAKEAAEAELAKFKGSDGKLIDPTAAIKAIETVANIDAKKLIDAGEVETVKAQIRKELTDQLNEKDQAIASLTTEKKSLLTDRVFDSSEFVRNRVAVPADMFRDSFGKYVKIADDGTQEFYDRDGNRLMSKANPGDYAKGDEAFELLVERHPQKDTILKAPDAGGTGGGGGGGNRPGGRTMKRAEFEALQSGKPQADAAAAMAKGELTIVD
jgi:hypothetical protein